MMDLSGYIYQYNLYNHLHTNLPDKDKSDLLNTLEEKDDIRNLLSATGRNVYKGYNILLPYRYINCIR
mgnify:CR=1 FL=1